MVLSPVANSLGCDTVSHRRYVFPCISDNLKSFSGSSQSGSLDFERKLVQWHILTVKINNLVFFEICHGGACAKVQEHLNRDNLTVG